MPEICSNLFDSKIEGQKKKKVFAPKMSFKYMCVMQHTFNPNSHQKLVEDMNQLFLNIFVFIYYEMKIRSSVFFMTI